MKHITRQQKILAFLKGILLIIVLQEIFTNFALANPKQNENQGTAIKDAIVKIYTVTNSPDYFNPWMMLGPKSGGGSGCIIEGNKILTNAHVVADHTFIQVRRYGQAERYKAKVLNVSHDADLALLTVEDKTFFSDVTPLKFGELAETQQEVLVYGFPFGGDSLSITKGVLSRIEHLFYVHSSHYLLAGQIDAAINPGNSGGPVLVNDRVVGVVMQMVKSNYAENIGYMVPIPVINHFFQDIEDGQYDGFPDIGIITQDMESPDMRRKYGMSETQTGLFVTLILPGSPAEGKMEKGDVLLSIEGHPIANDGTVEFRPKERTNYTYYVDAKQPGESVRAEVLSQETIKQVTLTLNQTRKAYLLVPQEEYEQLPRYFIYGGIVFTPLTKNLLERWGSDWLDSAPSDLVRELKNWVTEEKKEVVLVLKILAADVNTGYHDIRAWIVTEVNGKQIKDFDEFFQIVTQTTEPYLVFKDELGFQIVIDREKAEESHELVLRTYRIEHDRSQDLR
jgi:S1-C subfamily serine protease